jgi:hypothetical protein
MGSGELDAAIYFSHVAARCVVLEIAGWVALLSTN